MSYEWMSGLSAGLVALCCVGQLGGCIFGVDELKTNPSTLPSSNNGVALDMELDEGDDQRQDMTPSVVDPGIVDDDGCAPELCLCADGAQGQPIAFALSAQDELLFVPQPNAAPLDEAGADAAHTYTLAAYAPGAKTLKLLALDARGLPLDDSFTELSLLSTSSSKHLKQVVLSPQADGELLIGAWMEGGELDELYLFKAARTAQGQRFELMGRGELLLAAEEILAFGVNKAHLNGAALLSISRSDSTKGKGKDKALTLHGTFIDAGLTRLEPMSFDEKDGPITSSLEVTMRHDLINVAWLAQDKGKQDDMASYVYQRAVYMQDQEGAYHSLEKKPKRYDSSPRRAQSKIQPLWPVSADPDQWLYLQSHLGERGASLSFWQEQQDPLMLFSGADELLDQDYAPYDDSDGGVFVWLKGSQDQGTALMHAQVKSALPRAVSSWPLSRAAVHYDKVLVSPGWAQTTGIVGVTQQAQGDRALHFFMSVEGQAVCSPSTWRKAAP